MAAFSLLRPHTKDLGGFQVRRILPGHPHQMIGPFIFFDHMGPADFAAGKGIDVRPHPHIGLATVTYLFEGALMHRDSLGVVQRIEPGDVNWMTCGGGIVHSERSPAEERAAGHRLHGIQSWVALPQAHECSDASFSHQSKSALPVITQRGIEMRLIVGTAFGERAPTPSFSEIFYIAGELEAGSVLELPPEHEERAVYLVSGAIRAGGEQLEQRHMAVLPAQTTVKIEATADSRVMLLGGAKIDGTRHIYWNFVASSRELIEEAKARWRAQAFARVPGETEFIPLPAEPAENPVHYP